MNHRYILVFVVVFVLTLLSGCTAPPSIQVTDINNSEIAERTSRSFETLGDENSPMSRIRNTIKSAVINGSGKFNSTSPPIEKGQILEYNDSYYNISWKIIDQIQGTRISIGIDYNPSESNLTGRRVNYTDLPSIDKNILSGLLPPRERPPESEGIDIGVGSVLNNKEMQKSVLAEKKYEIVVYEGTPYPIQVETERVQLNIYNYTVDLDFTNATMYANSLKEKYLFELSGLSNAEKKIMREAMNDTYYVEDSNKTAFKSLIEKLRRHKAVKGGDEYSGDWLVEYKENVYWIQARYGQLEE